jgi:hypothetical protein
MTDIIIYESGNGGEISIKAGDIETTDGLLNMPYLSHFGGNVETSTTGNEIEGIERLDWWGNQFLETESQMNSELERSLLNNALNSNGRANIEKDATKDIQILNKLGNVSSSVEITGQNKVKISDTINQITIDFIWDATNKELIEERTI